MVVSARRRHTSFGYTILSRWRYVVSSASAYRHFAALMRLCAVRLRPNALFQRRSMMREPPMRASSLWASAKLLGGSARDGLALATLSQAVAQSRADAWPHPKEPP